MKAVLHFLWQRKFAVLFYFFLSYFSYLMLLITLQYFPIDIDVAFLRIKQDVIRLTHYQLAFFTHIYTSIFVLFFGFFQFSNTLRKRQPLVHRGIGKMYVFLILYLAAPSGLLMGYYANGGWIAQIAFMLLALLWFYFTMKAFHHAKKKDFIAHRKFMIRSFALTLSAISLRLLKWGIVSIWELPPMDTTKIIAWCGWMLNLAFVELYFVFENRQLNYIK